VFRYSFTGGLRKITLGLTNPIAIEEDPSSGDFLVATAAGDVYRVTPAGQITTLFPRVFPAAMCQTATMCTEFDTGQILVAWDGQLHRFDPTRGRTTTLSASYPLVADMDRDPIGGGFLALGGGGLIRFDPQNGASVLIASLGGPVTIPTHVATWGRRMLTGMARPASGVVYPITLAMPGEAGVAYQAAASFTIRPGIPTPAGRIHLATDALYHFSLAAPTMFRRFSGSLDANGSAQLDVKIPSAPAYVGQRFFIAAVSYDFSGIRRISEPLGVTIE